MSRVLIHEPHDDIRVLLELVVTRLGHEPVASRDAAGDESVVDAAVIEPTDAEGLRIAQALRAENVPVLFTSIYPASDALLELGPCAYLVKPFPIYALERSLESALRESAPAPAA